jgi:hypothetical protein
MEPILTLSGDFASNTLAYVGQLFTDTSTIIYLAIGLPLGFWVIRKVVGLIRAR